MTPFERATGRKTSVTGDAARAEIAVKQEELANQRREQDMQSLDSADDNATRLAMANLGQKPQEQQQNPSQTPPPGAMSTLGSQVTYGAPSLSKDDVGGALGRAAMGGTGASNFASSVGSVLFPKKLAEGGPVEAPEPAQGYTLDPDVVQLLGEEFLDRITSFVQVTKHQLQQQQSGPPSEVM
jgi:hypothetical protein